MFAYCGNNPVDRVDISGHACYDDLWEMACDAVESVAEFVEDVVEETVDYLCSSLLDIGYV